MRMSSLVKKGDGKAKSNHAGPLSKEAGVKTAPSKPGEPRNADAAKAADQLNPKVLPTAEQLRIAQMISDSKRDDPDLPEKVSKLVELTNCSADAAIIALHDSNNDLDQAIAALLDGETEGDWEVSGKKKKPKQLSHQQGSSSPDATEGVNTGNGTTGSGRGRDRARSGRGGPPRLRGRGRGRDNKENFEDAEGDAAGSRGRGSRGGPRMSNGPGREGSSGGRGGGRGGRGGLRRGPRPTPSDNWDESGGDFSNMTNVEPWNSGANNDFPSAEDWDNEEYIGSLVETKVFTPSSSGAPGATAVPDPSAVAGLTNGSGPTDGSSSAQQQPPSQQSQAPPPQVHYSTLNNSAAQQGIDLNALLQKTSGVTVAGGGSLQQQFLGYGGTSQQQATDALKAAMGVGGSSAASKAAAKPLRAKIPPPSKIPLSAVEMPDDPLVSGLDVKFGTLDFGIEPSGFDMGGLDVSMIPSSSAAGLSKQQADHLQQQHSLMSKMDQQQQQYGPGGSQQQQQQPPAPSSLPKPDASLSGFSGASGVSSGQQQSMSNSAPAQAKAANSGAYGSYGGTASYAPPGVNTSSSQPAGAYPSANQTSTVGGYNSTSASSVYQGTGNQTAYGSYGQQQQQQQAQSSNYQSYNNKMNSTDGASAGAASSLRGVDLPSSSATSAASRSTTTSAATANKPAGAGTTLTGSGTGLPNLPPGVPTMLGPGGFIMGQAPGLPYYAAAAAAAGIQQHPVYSLEDMQYRYPHLAAGYYDMGYQSPTSLGTGRGDGTLASLAYATGSDASKFSRNENNSPVPTSLSQNAAQSHGGAFITPAAAAPTPLTPAYAYYYSGGVMPGGYQFGAPAALYPVSAAASGHPGGGAAGTAANQYGKAGPLGGGATGSSGGGAQAGQAAQSGAGGAGGGGQSNAGGTASGYASYGSTYDEFSKSVYGSVSAGGQAAKMGGGASAGAGGPSGVGGGASGSADLGPNVYGKTHNQLSKINTYDKTGGFHTGTPPPYGLAGNASGAPLGVGVSVGVGGPSPYGGQHMFIPTLAPHQSQHSHLMHQQLHQDSSSGPGQRSQTGQQNKQGSKPSYGGSYWGST